MDWTQLCTFLGKEILYCWTHSNSPQRLLPIIAIWYFVARRSDTLLQQRYLRLNETVDENQQVQHVRSITDINLDIGPDIWSQSVSTQGDLRRYRQYFVVVIDPKDGKDARTAQDRAIQRIRGYLARNVVDSARLAAWYAGQAATAAEQLVKEQGQDFQVQDDVRLAALSARLVAGVTAASAKKVEGSATSDPISAFKALREARNEMIRTQNHARKAFLASGVSEQQLPPEVLCVFMPPVTDVLVLCHGWHRLFMDALVAYDRIMGRLTDLQLRGRIGGREYRPYNPLYICLHWQSDPGVDKIRNRIDARMRAAFHARCQDIFEPMLTEMIPEKWLTLEQLLDMYFDFFTEFAEAGPKGFDKCTVLGNKSSFLQTRLNGLKPKAQWAEAGPAEIYALLLLAYQEAPKRDKATPQMEDPRPMVGVLSAIMRFHTFLLRTLTPVGAILLESLMGVCWLHATFGALWPWVLLVSGIVLGVIFFRETANLAHQRNQKSGRAPRNTHLIEDYVPPSFASQLVLLLLTLLASLLLVVWCTLGGAVQAALSGWAKVKKGSEEGNKMNTFQVVAHRLASFALLPIRHWLSKTHNTTVDGTLLAGIEAQLTFWEKQADAGRVGVQAGDFLVRLYTEVSCLKMSRLHLIGHSFGGAVVAHAAQQVATADQKQRIRMESLGLLLPALRTDWFSDKFTIIKRLRRLFCVFSCHDSANRHYFPFANGNQASAGDLGICDVPIPDDFSAGKVEHFPIEPERVRADYLDLDYEVGAKRILNLDASRIAFRGEFAMGGGHGDVFSEDVALVAFAHTVGASFRRDARQQRQEMDLEDY